MRNAMFGALAWAATSGSAAAQETVNVVVPSAVSFPVTDVTQSTSGGPSPTTISFANANLKPGKALRVSVQADGAAFTPPSGPGIPTSTVEWTMVGAAGGTGWSGTLAATKGRVSVAHMLDVRVDAHRCRGHFFIAAFEIFACALCSADTCELQGMLTHQSHQPTSSGDSASVAAATCLSSLLSALSPLSSGPRRLSRS